MSTSDKSEKPPPPVKSLVVTSHGAPAGAPLPVLAALEAAGHRVRAIDIGRAGARYASTVERVMKAISSEFSERRLARELASNSPDVALAFDPASASALTELRRHSSGPVPVIAVIAELEPDPAWAGVAADRYLTIDAEAAVTLADGGVPSERIMTVGPITAFEYAAAGQQRREVLRARFKLPISERVVLVKVAGLGAEMASQLALQLALIDAPVTYLFAAGDDLEAANALRRQAPTLSLRAKLFGKMDDEALLWRAADIIVAVPTDEVAQRALAINTMMIALLPDDAGGQRVVAGIADREMGTQAVNALMVSGALEPLLATAHKPSARTGADGAANVADIATIVGRHKAGVVGEGRVASSAAFSGASETINEAAPSGLEDLSGGLEDLFAVNQPGDAQTRKLAAMRARMEQLGKSVGAAQEAADQWEAKKSAAQSAGDHSRAAEAGKKADAERTAMHSSLGEMSKIEAELRVLEGRETKPRASAPRGGGGRTGARRRPSADLDAVLKEMKRREGASVEDELAALKKKMTNKRGES